MFYSNLLKRGRVSALELPFRCDGLEFHCVVRFPLGQVFLTESLYSTVVGLLQNALGFMFAVSMAANGFDWFDFITNFLDLLGFSARLLANK